MGASALLLFEPSNEIFGNSHMQSTATLTTGPLVRHDQITRMAVAGALSQSGGLSRLGALLMQGRAVLTPSGVLSVSPTVAFLALSTLSLTPKQDEDAPLEMAALAALSLSAGPDVLFSLVPMQAHASLVTQPYVALVESVTFLASALMIFLPSQFVFEGTYLQVDGPYSTMFFSANSYPTPREIRNYPSVVNVGGVHT
jgi:hypothetical protein